MRSSSGLRPPKRGAPGSSGSSLVRGIHLEARTAFMSWASVRQLHGSVSRVGSTSTCEAISGGVSGDSTATRAEGIQKHRLSSAEKDCAACSECALVATKRVRERTRAASQCPAGAGRAKVYSSDYGGRTGRPYRRRYFIMRARETVRSGQLPKLPL